jgi:hypothetical protein
MFFFYDLLFILNIVTFVLQKLNPMRVTTRSQGLSDIYLSLATFYEYIFTFTVYINHVKKKKVIHCSKWL